MKLIPKNINSFDVLDPNISKMLKLPAFTLWEPGKVVKIDKKAYPIIGTVDSVSFDKMYAKEIARRLLKKGVDVDSPRNLKITESSTMTGSPRSIILKRATLPRHVIIDPEKSLGSLAGLRFLESGNAYLVANANRTYQALGSTAFHEGTMHGTDPIVKSLDKLNNGKVLQDYRDVIKELALPPNGEKAALNLEELRATTGELAKLIYGNMRKNKLIPLKDFNLESHIPEFEEAVDHASVRDIANAYESINSYGRVYAENLRDQSLLNSDKLLNMFKEILKNGVAIAAPVALGTTLNKKLHETNT